MNDATARRPRLTDQILDDLPVAAATLRDEIDYLDDAIRQHADMPQLVEHFKSKHSALVRAEVWLSRFADATRSHRQLGVPEDNEGAAPQAQEEIAG